MRTALTWTALAVVITMAAGCGPLTTPGAHPTAPVTSTSGAATLVSDPTQTPDPTPTAPAVQVSAAPAPTSAAAALRDGLSTPAGLSVAGSGAQDLTAGEVTGWQITWLADTAATAAAAMTDLANQLTGAGWTVTTDTSSLSGQRTTAQEQLQVNVITTPAGADTPISVQLVLVHTPVGAK